MSDYWVSFAMLLAVNSDAKIATANTAKNKKRVGFMATV
jgi:hypothetical protein